MRRRALLILGPVLMATGLVAVPLHAASSAPAAKWKGTPTYVSGSSRYDRGEWIYTDFVFDDYGADTGTWGQPNVVSLAGTTGDARYPESPAFAGNAADIVEARVRVDRNDLDVRVLLQTLIEPDVVAITVGLGDGAPVVMTSRNATIDSSANTVSFRLPGAAASDAVALTIGAGVHDGAGGLRAGVAGTQRMSPDEVTTGGPTENRLFDLAFNTREIEPRGGPWNEDAQSAALASGDLAPYAQTIDLDALRDRIATAGPTAPGYYVRLFESRQSLGEGILGSRFGGRWQPYALWVPEGHVASAPTPLFLNLHSLSVHHNQYRGGDSPTYGTFYEQTGDVLGALVATPLGRGPSGWYHDEALVDTLEVWADVQRRFAVDRDRTVVGGYSMGGYGTYRLTTLFPDAFASAVSVVGPPANGVWAYPLPPSGGADSPDVTRPQLENTRHVPFWITQGVLDELVPFLGVKHQADRFAELGHEHRFSLHPSEDHLSFAVKDNWQRETAWLASHLVRTRNPHEITYKVRPATWSTVGDPSVLSLVAQLAHTVGARLDGAYWVDDVVTAGEGDVTGFVELASGGVATRRGAVTPVQTAGVDGPSPYTLTGVDVARSIALRSDTLTGRLTNVSSLTVDVERAGLSNSPAVAVTADRPVTITLVRKGDVVGTVALVG